ncbi:hypothetical protein EVAR_9487_1 [Eumeta japonica]|uniref:Uncharacterized protein n=1 Tax=Eumeta variegata TaxID=151549 RepID=A0A4C2A5I5_EUMVA|nr:hypothetical protein EVAR_9487_1 [Eumeta japonica]
MAPMRSVCQTAAPHPTIKGLCGQRNRALAGVEAAPASVTYISKGAMTKVLLLLKTFGPAKPFFIYAGVFAMAARWPPWPRLEAGRSRGTELAAVLFR